MNDREWLDVVEARANEALVNPQVPPRVYLKAEDWKRLEQLAYGHRSHPLISEGADFSPSSILLNVSRARIRITKAVRERLTE